MNIDDKRLSDNAKRLVLMIGDAIFLAIALWVALVLRYGDIYRDVTGFWWQFPVVSVLGVAAFYRFGLYRAIVRYIGPSSMLPVVQGVTVAAVGVYISAYLHQDISFPRSSPVIFWFIGILFWREFHFYWVHRLIHIKPLYKHVHYLHHKNVNPNPWSGMAMHPVETILYLSVCLIHWVIPSHPIHFMFTLIHAGLAPAGGHDGFEGPLIKGKFPAGSYFHYLHHRYFFSFHDRHCQLHAIFVL